MASVSKYRGKWKCQVRRKGNPALFRTFDRHSDAVAWGREMEAQIDAGLTIVVPKKRDVQTVADLLDWYLGLDEAKAKKSHQDDKERAERIKKHLGKLDAIKVNSDHLKDYKNMRLAMPRSAPQTVQHELALLHRAYVLAVEELRWRLPEGVPRTRRPVIDNARDRRVRRDELLQLIQHTGSREAAIIMELAVETAMRRGEIMGLEWERIDLERQSAYLPDTKSGSPRTVPLSRRAVDLLRSVKREDATGKVFHIADASVSQALKRAAKRIGAQDLRFHDLRHEATSRLFEKGLNQIEVARITGHKTLSMLNRYTHLDVQHLVGKLG
ncbi:hypothetical protein CAL26_21045 [Bordetella genomosp. 9]|uniref:Tyr recombinase domain-containing protein n=1 Tax=Bordetella genomosp. 9 TaxID=1416803 RepID=A0A261R6S2_9BORD|nr:site-specific integrase [Bordetella genomosp. 9]OZI20043.1 hypothetical protein CAL26_21045 [Bordetella genomosp. 9]